MAAEGEGWTWRGGHKQNEIAKFAISAPRK